jgi:glycosyltransferase involved in cell wall biosynthesis
MKVYLPTSDDAKTGKGLFINRLSKELSNYTEVTNKSEKCDIALHLIKIEKVNAKHHIIRYDGVYHNTDQDYKHINKEISKHMKNAHGVVYQSEFSKIMCKKYLGKFTGPSAVIHNGIDISSFNNVKPMDSPYKYNIMAVSRWRPHKRLRDIIESFLLANINDSMLWVAGELDNSGLSKKDINRYSKVKFLGRIDQSTLTRYYKLCNASIHLCWFDCCPNSVVEAIAANCVIISNNVGGTPELTKKSNGIICNIDAPYDYKPVKLYNPPKINRSIVAEAIQLACKGIKVENQFIDIKNIAKQYLEFFNEVNK